MLPVQSSANRQSVLKTAAAALAQTERIARPSGSLLKTADPNSTLTQIIDYIKERPWLAGSLLGATGGGLYGAVSDLQKDEDERTPIQSALSGALGGGLLGLGGGLAYEHLPKFLEGKPDAPKNTAPPTDYSKLENFYDVYTKKPGATIPDADRAAYQEFLDPNKTPAGLPMGLGKYKSFEDVLYGRQPVSAISAGDQSAYEDFLRTPRIQAALEQMRKEGNPALLSDETKRALEYFLPSLQEPSTPAPKMQELPDYTGEGAAEAAALQHEVAMRQWEKDNTPSALGTMARWSPITAPAVAADIYTHRPSWRDLKPGALAEMNRWKEVKTPGVPEGMPKPAPVPNPYASVYEHVMDPAQAKSLWRSVSTAKPGANISIPQSGIPGQAVELPAGKLRELASEGFFNPKGELGGKPRTWGEGTNFEATPGRWAGRGLVLAAPALIDNVARWGARLFGGSHD